MRKIVFKAWSKREKKTYYFTLSDLLDKEKIKEFLVPLIIMGITAIFWFTLGSVVYTLLTYELIKTAYFIVFCIVYLILYIVYKLRP